MPPISKDRQTSIFRIPGSSTEARAWKKSMAFQLRKITVKLPHLEGAFEIFLPPKISTARRVYEMLRRKTTRDGIFCGEAPGKSVSF
jgi:hypothetical protein